MTKEHVKLIMKTFIEREALIDYGRESFLSQTLPISILALYCHYEAESSLSVPKDSNIVGSAQTQRTSCRVLLHCNVVNEGTNPLRFYLILTILFSREHLRVIS